MTIFSSITLRQKYNIKTKFKTQKIIVSIFLLTLFNNNIYSSSVSLEVDSIINKSNTDFQSEIKKYASDSIQIDIINRKAFLYGNAEIDYQKTNIKAGYIEIDWDNNTIYAKTIKDSLGNNTGHPIFKEGNETFKADYMKYNFKTKKCYVTKISTSEGDGYLLGEKVKKTRENIFYLKNGDYTTCDAEKPHYSIRSRKIKIIPKDKIITGPAHLRFFNLPTPIFFPFGFFPNNDKQSSGILIPSYGESEELGFFLKDGGYYFKIKNKADLSIKSDIYSKGSWSTRSNLRYKSIYKYNGNINLSYSNIINSIKGFPDYNIKKDFFIRWKHQQDPKSNPYFLFSANINAGSSTFHRNNLINNSDFLNNTFQSSINISKKWKNSPFNLSINARHNQNSQNKIVNLSIPELALNMNRIFPFSSLGDKNKTNWYNKIGLSYNLSTKNTINIADSLLLKSSFSDFKNGMKHTMPISTSIKLFKYLTLNPRLNLTERWYLKKIKKEWNSNSNTIEEKTLNKFTRGIDYNFSTSLNTKIYGILQFPKRKITAIRHVITPNLSFSYNPDMSEYKNNGFATVRNELTDEYETYSTMKNGIYGSPSNTKNGYINLNIGNILGVKIKKENDSTQQIKKIKIIESLNFGTSYDIFKDSLNFSNINLNARTRIVKLFDINFSSTYDLYKSNMQQTRNINEFEIENGRLARFIRLNTSIGMNLSNQTFSKNNKEEDFFNIPWNFRAHYSLTYNKGYKSSKEADTVQLLNFSGNIKITKKWKIGFRSGFDFDTKKLTYTTIDVYRDLHCWEMMFNYIPLGFHRSYTLTIRVKSNILKDLKYERKKDWFDPEYN